MLLGTLGASLLGNILASKGAIATSQGREIYKGGKGRRINRGREGAIATRQGRGIVRAGYGRCSSKMDF